MILAIDIGNTRTTFALVHDLHVVASEHGSSSRLSFRRAREIVRKLCGSETEKISGIGIASVVPQLTDLVANATEEILGRKAVIISSSHAHVSASYSTPDTIGADRLCNAVAAFHFIRNAAIVIDCGTAITLDCIASDGAFLGGAILPGYGTASRSLSTTTAQLPEIAFTDPGHALGNSTDECLRSGIVLGTTYAVEGLLGRIIFETYANTVPELVVTGGHADIFVASSMLTVKKFPDLVLQGAALIAGKTPY